VKSSQKSDFETTIVKFPMLIAGDWRFCISTTNQNNILIFAAQQSVPCQFLVRFFDKEAIAAAWIKSIMD